MQFYTQPSSKACSYLISPLYQDELRQIFDHFSGKFLSEFQKILLPNFEPLAFFESFQN
jgi:hypothetical protein